MGTFTNFNLRRQHLLPKRSKLTSSSFWDPLWWLLPWPALTHITQTRKSRLDKVLADLPTLVWVLLEVSEVRPTCKFPITEMTSCYGLSTAWVLLLFSI